MNDNSTELAYYLTLYKIEGHQTYRAVVNRAKGDFDRHLTPGHPKIIKKEVYRIDRLNGVIDIAD